MRQRAVRWQWVLLAGLAPLWTTAVVDRAGPDHGTFYGNPFEEQEKAEAEAEDAADRASAAPEVFDELFDTSLPGQYKEGDWSLRLNPKMGDYFDDDTIRVLAGVRYNFSNYFDASTDLGAYFGNSFRDEDGIGLYTWRLGGRYTWFNVAKSRANVAAGFNLNFPIGDPPLELTDGYARYEPYVTVSNRFTSLPDWLFYLNTTYQVVADAPLRDSTPHPKAADRLFLRPGAIFYPGGRFRYSIELEYSTNALDFSPHAVPSGEPPDILRENWILAHQEVHEIMAYPAITWFPTRKTREWFIIPGNWDLSLRLKVPILEETGKGFGLSLRLRWYYDYLTFLREDLPGAFRRGPPGE